MEHFQNTKHIGPKKNDCLFSDKYNGSNTKNGFNLAPDIIIAIIIYLFIHFLLSWQ